MYSFDNLTEMQAATIGIIVENEVRRIQKRIARERENLDYQQQNNHIFATDGTIETTRKTVEELEAKLKATRAVLDAIKV